NRHLMSDQGAEALAGKPGVKVKSGRLHLERGRAEFSEIKIDRVVRRRTDRGRNTRKHRQRRPVNMAGRDELHARMTPDDGFESGAFKLMLALHVRDAGLERRMMQKQQRGPV